MLGSQVHPFRRVFTFKKETYDQVYPQGEHSGEHLEDMAPKRQTRAPTKAPVKVTKKVVVQTKRGRARAPKAPKVPTFGPVTTIDTAPVSIGNTFGGAKPVVTGIPDGQRIRGRDFLCNIDPSAATVVSWTMVAGAPISPLCMISSGVKSMVQMYGKYCVHGIAIHYITACTTADAGTLMIYIGKDRAEPGLITTNNNFLPVVLSDPNTVISPVWKNCSAVYRPSPAWYTTDLFNGDGLHEQGPGEVFAYIRIPSTNVPGYFLIDYDISFMTMQVNIKSLSLPVSRMKYTQVRMYDGAAVTGQVATYDIATVGQFLLDGVTSSTVPSGYVVGDIYKIIANNEDGYAGAAALSLSYTVNMAIAGGAASISVTSYQDGATFYGVATTNTALVLYPNYYCAYTGHNPLLQSLAINGAVHSYIAYISLVGSVIGGLLQANY